jgi:hypothetical protein
MKIKVDLTSECAMKSKREFLKEIIKKMTIWLEHFFFKDSKLKYFKFLTELNQISILLFISYLIIILLYTVRPHVLKPNSQFFLIFDKGFLKESNMV